MIGNLIACKYISKMIDRRYMIVSERILKAKPIN